MKHGCAILADIHQTMVEGVRGLLETLFSTVVMVADLESLNEAIKKLQPDVAVVDLSMPGSKNANIARELNDKYPGY